jgi:hypothetical protein
MQEAAEDLAATKADKDMYTHRTTSA